MFIVVAIVIFGIFVSLSYTLFGKTLQPQIVGLFNESIEQVNHKIGKTISIETMYLRNFTGTQKVYNKTKNSIVYSSDGYTNIGDGIFFESKQLKVDKKYKLSFDFKVLEGEVDTLGGHLYVSNYDKVNVKINNQPIKNQIYSNGITHDFKVNENYHIDVEFETDNVIIDENGVFRVKDILTTGAESTRIYIQPNRGSKSTGYYKVEMSDITYITR